MTGQLPNDRQAIRLLQEAYNISRWEAAKIHHGDRAIWWLRFGLIAAVETIEYGYKELPSLERVRSEEDDF